MANINYYRALFGYYKLSDDLEKLIGGLRTAGMPEWPLGLGKNQEDRLSSDAMSNLVFGRTWTGRHAVTGIPFIQEISESGTLAYRSVQSFLTGDAMIEQDMLCQRSQSYFFNQKICGHIYRNPAGSADTQDEFFYLTADAAKYFSLVK